MSGTLEAAVEAALATIRPALEMEGGAVDLIAVERGIARVRLRVPGAVSQDAAMGLLLGIQHTVQAATGEVRAVVNQDLVDAGYPVEHLAAQMERYQVQGSRSKVQG